MRSQPLALLVGSFFAGVGAGLTFDVSALMQPPEPDEAPLEAPPNDGDEVSREALPGDEDEAPPIDADEALLEDLPNEEAEDEGPCAGFQQPGCVQDGCPEGQVCRIGVECVPTLCSCDPETGQSLCSLDCEGGTCVDGTRDCPKLACRLLCTFGRERDEDGCEVCRCREAPECPCASDDECVKVTTGCCPCDQGGTELAIGRACERELAQCPVAPEAVPCLAFDRCTNKQARCVAGRCVLQNTL